MRLTAIRIAAVGTIVTDAVFPACLRVTLTASPVAVPLTALVTARAVPVLIAVTHKLEGVVGVPVQVYTVPVNTGNTVTVGFPGCGVFWEIALFGGVVCLRGDISCDTVTFVTAGAVPVPVTLTVHVTTVWQPGTRAVHAVQPETYVVTVGRATSRGGK